MTHPTDSTDSTDATTDAPGSRRRDVLDALRQSATPLSIVDIARRLDVHPNTARFHLDTLVERGQVEQVAGARVGPGRPPLMFRARPGMDRTGPRNYRLLASVLVAELSHRRRPAHAAIKAGRTWGERLVAAPDSPDVPNSPAAPGAPETPGTSDTSGTSDATADAHTVNGLVHLLDELGFAPDRPPQGAVDRIGLRHCPFLDLAEAQPQVVCPLHLGLIQGALATMKTSLTADRLESFVEPDLCLVHLGRVATAVEGKGR